LGGIARARVLPCLTYNISSDGMGYILPLPSSWRRRTGPPKSYLNAPGRKVGRPAQIEMYPAVAKAAAGFLYRFVVRASQSVTEAAATWVCPSETGSRMFTP